jgi:hypothetical protein
MNEITYESLIAYKDLIGSVTTILVGMLAACIAFLTAWLTNRQNDKLNKERLKNEAAEKERDRAFSVQKEIYLTAIDSYVNLAAVLGSASFNNLDSEFFLTKIADFHTSFNRVKMIGNIEIIALSIKIIEGISKLLMGIVSHKLSIMDDEIDIDINDKSFEKLINDHNRIIELMRDMHISLDPDNEKFDRLQNISKQNSSEQAALIGENSELRDKVQASKVELTKLIVTEIRKIDILFAEFAIKVRCELVQNNDGEEEEKIKELLRETNPNMVPEFENFMEKLKS